MNTFRELNHPNTKEWELVQSSLMLFLVSMTGMASHSISHIQVLPGCLRPVLPRTEYDVLLEYTSIIQSAPFEPMAMNINVDWNTHNTMLSASSAHIKTWAHIFDLSFVLNLNCTTVCVPSSIHHQLHVTTSSLAQTRQHMLSLRPR
jgi:hypothetical protein